MIFRPELAAKVMAREKWVTRRLVSANPRSPWHEDAKWPAGKVFTVQPGRGVLNIGRARVERADVMELGHIGFAEALAEGCASEADFEALFAGINGIYDPNARVWVIRFEVVS